MPVRSPEMTPALVFVTTAEPLRIPLLPAPVPEIEPELVKSTLLRVSIPLTRPVMVPLLAISTLLLLAAGPMLMPRTPPEIAPAFDTLATSTISTPLIPPRDCTDACVGHLTILQSDALIHSRDAPGVNDEAGAVEINAGGVAARRRNDVEIVH